MPHLRLKDGAPDEPDTGDWDAICATPRVGNFFVILFKEVAGFDLPEPVIESDSEDAIRHVRTGWRDNRTKTAPNRQADLKGGHFRYWRQRRRMSGITGIGADDPKRSYVKGCPPSFVSTVTRARTRCADATEIQEKCCKRRPLVFG